MCGICGFIDLRAEASESDHLRQVERMTATLVHRGPDSDGCWADAAAGAALGHRRLSIVDLSAEGAQPMASACGRFVLAFNGEIYNYRDIRVELERRGDRFRGHSDTEVLIQAVAAWGAEACLTRLNGMFAFAVWDRRNRSLFLARDRIGEKPLYYGWSGGVFLFGSELKALRAHPGFAAGVDAEAVAAYLRRGYVPAPLSIYRGIRKLPAGTWLRIDSTRGAELDPVPYWRLTDAVEAGSRDPWCGSPAEAVEELDRLLRDSVRLRMEADVPLGAFLSGGIDSSAVVALMQAQRTDRVRTFSIGFTADGYDEAPHARAVAEHLGTDHRELYITSDEALGVIPRLSTLYDEPFGDASQIPTHLVARLARQHVSVALSGDGGDELFGGYTRYQRAASLWRWTRRLPQWFRAPLAHSARLRGRIVALSSNSLGLPPVGSGLRSANRLADYLAAAGIEEMYDRFISHWEDEALVQCAAGAADGRRPPTRTHSDPIHAMMYRDGVEYLPDDILVKVDRATLAVGLEARVPLLDYRIVEFAWRLPLALKVSGRTGKWVLREVLKQYVPSSLYDRPKRGFAVPVDRWLRGPLRPWAEELLEPRRLAAEGYFDPAVIRASWSEHLRGVEGHRDRLWLVLMFQAWLDEERLAGFPAAAESLAHAVDRR
jgi:asparagine synthase (glutamine-hydrolysing)